ncbi:precorrin-6y C5,15-methyltransferase (decarboxylating) subunit CbiE [Clostridium sp. A1-XYC3]|uniref:Precorrin-6y C5,15-methyltransferase (Decarboxylating) subunit CbiE n=1 Tax=Clostridium tanneri TaxID=3037988 RepID=A0ABU4JUK7_9CLOT|nr:precorrin-6y C5,15-methyltransferase (decarboxylating) subunit CbiE [Clostridium sp. A1-XYC3]MDW8801840.1 precorrin-6y C5,15-methyltransferase (decarboxylating) subunit CbiE [Clostridium sp. A1-XYC3]
MDGKVYVVGIGPGHKDYILPKAVDTLKKSDLILGFERAIESLAFIDGNKIIVKKLSEIINIINSSEYKRISIAASGDPLFYGVTDYLKKNYSGNLEVIPGLSSFQYMMARIGKSWQGCFLGSLHGREDNFHKVVRENRISIWLTDNKHSPSYLCKVLEEKNINVKVYVGENLSYEDEKITKGTAEEIKNMEFSNLCVVTIENEDMSNKL